MTCPKCGAENLKGKLLCYKCGAKLMQAPKVAPQAGKEPVRKKRGFRALYYLFLLIFLGVIFYLMLQKPEIKSLEVSPQAAKRLEKKLHEIEGAVSAKKSLKVEVTEEELNSLISQQFGELEVDREYAKKNVKVDDIQIGLEGEKLKSVVTMKVKGKPVYVSLAGKVALVNSHLTLKPDGVKIGKLPVPAKKTVEQAMKRVEKKRGSLSFLELPEGVRSIRVEGGKLIIETGPEEEEAPVEVEVKPAAPEKRVLTEEELEELKREREENEAKSWLQVGDNFANIKLYDSAFKYYRKVIDKYPEREEAKEAKQRIEEIKAKLRSGE